MAAGKNRNSEQVKKKVFIGGNYDGMALLRKISDCIDKEHFDPQIVLVKYPNLRPWEIYSKCMEVLKECEYAIFEETFPAGELMELESVATSRKINTLVIYQTRGPQFFDYPSSLTSMVRSLAQERQFEGITLAGYSSIEALSPLIRAFLGQPFVSEKCLLILSIGTLDKIRPAHRMKGLEEFEGDKVILTGWHFKRAVQEADRLNASAIVYEACLLSTRKEMDGESHWSEPLRLYRPRDVERVKHLNKVLWDEICLLDKEPVFFSQGNSVSIDYYVNPPRESYRDFTEKWQVAPDKDASHFISHLVEGYGVDRQSITRMSDTCLRLSDSPHNRYLVEKVNAAYRTFVSYTLTFEQSGKDSYIIVDLDFDRLNKQLEQKWRDKKEWSYEFLEKVVRRAKDNPIENLCDKDWAYVTPNHDCSIDIFAQTKDKCWEQAMRELQKKKLYEKGTPVFYISNATESDRVLIARAYSEPSIEFCAFGLSDMFKEDFRRSTPLITAGVIVKNELNDILDIIRPLKKRGLT